MHHILHRLAASDQGALWGAEHHARRRPPVRMARMGYWGLPWGICAPLLIVERCTPAQQYIALSCASSFLCRDMLIEHAMP